MAAGFAVSSFLASFKGPEAPSKQRVSHATTVTDILLLGRAVIIEANMSEKHTLRLGEVTLVNTSLDSLVELVVEHGRRRVVEVVIVLDIFLDRLATTTMIESACDSDATPNAARGEFPATPSTAATVKRTG